MLCGVRVWEWNSSNSDDEDVSLETIKQALREQCLSYSSSMGMSSLEFLHKVDKAQDRLALAYLFPAETENLKCDKCPQEFCSTISYRRHLRLHRRKLNLDKESAGKLRGLLQDFWDKLSVEEAVKICSFDDVSLEGVSGPSIRKALTLFLKQRPENKFTIGSSLLEIIQGSTRSFPMSSRKFFGILDNASEKTFLCSGTAETLQKFVFDGDAAKIGLESRNLSACAAFLLEQNLVKAYRAVKDAEALRHQKLLLEEEEIAAQERQAVILKKKSEKKLRQKARKAKELINGNINGPLKEIISSPPSSIPANDHDSTREMLEIPFDATLKPSSQPLNDEGITDTGHDNKYPDFGTPGSIHADDHDSIGEVLEIPSDAALSPEPSQPLHGEGITDTGHDNKYPDFGATPSSIDAADHDSTRETLGMPFVAAPSPEPSQLLNIEGITDKDQKNKYRDFGAPPSPIHASDPDSAREMLELPLVAAPSPEPSQLVNVESYTDDQENRHPDFGSRKKGYRDLGAFQNIERRTLNQIGRKQVMNSPWQATQSHRVPAVSYTSQSHPAPRPDASQKRAPLRSSNTSANSTEVWKPKPKSESRQGRCKTSLLVDEPKPPCHEMQLLIGSILVPLGNSVIEGQDGYFGGDGGQVPIQKSSGASDVCDVPHKVTHPACGVESTYGCEDESDSCLEARHQGGLTFSTHVLQAFHARRWKEALMGDHVVLDLLHEEPPRHSEAQGVHNKADLSTKEDKCSVLHNAENLLPVNTVTDSSAAMKPKVRGKHRNGRKMNYHKQRSGT